MKNLYIFTVFIFVLVLETEAQLRTSWGSNWQRRLLIQTRQNTFPRQQTVLDIPPANLCPQGFDGNVPFPGNCSRFVRCGIPGHNSAFFDCAEGTLYNQESQRCSQEEFVNCLNGVRAQRSGLVNAQFNRPIRWNSDRFSLNNNNRQNTNLNSNRLNTNTNLNTDRWNTNLNRNTGLNNRWNTGLNNRLNTDLNNRLNTGLNARLNTGLNARLNTGLNTRVNTGLHNRLNNGLNSRLTTTLNNNRNTRLNNNRNTVPIVNSNIRRTIEVPLVMNNVDILDTSACTKIQDRLNAALPELVRAFSASCRDATCLSSLPTFRVRCSQTTRGTNLFTG